MHKQVIFDRYAFADYSGAGPDRQQRQAIAWAVAGRLTLAADSKARPDDGLPGAEKPGPARGVQAAAATASTSAQAQGQGGVSARKGFTRQSLYEAALALLRLASTAGERVLFGFDHNYSFPVGFYDAVTGRAPANWRELVDWLYASMQDFVENDRLFPRKWAAMQNRLLEQRHGWPVGPFWGPHFQPLQRRFVYTPSDTPYEAGEAPRIRDHRLTELRHPSAKSIFQLGGNGSVGLQSLFGIYYLKKLLDRCAEEGIAVHAWPYDGWDIPATGHVLIEVYPTLFVPPEQRRSDAGDAEACANWALAADADGTLRGWLAKPQKLDPAAEARVLLEGWIAGVEL